MVGLVHTFETDRSYASKGFSNAPDTEPVIVTPCRTSSEFGRAAIRDRVFAGHCMFSWRAEKVSMPAGDGKRMLVFNRYKQTGMFERSSLHDQIPREGDQVTRTWDGTTFQIAAVYRLSTHILCDLVEVEKRIQ